MKNRINTKNPPLESLKEGDIVATEDGYVLICVPDSQSDCGKALTDGDLWFVDDSQLGVDYWVLQPGVSAAMLTDDKRTILAFVLRRAQEQHHTESFYSRWFRLNSNPSVN